LNRAGSYDVFYWRWNGYWRSCRTHSHLIFTEEIDPSVDYKVFKQEELLLT
jgi:hypothetical protein